MSLDQPPSDHGSDRYDYVEVNRPEGIAVPENEPWFQRLVAEPCPDCRANVFVTWAPEVALGWSVQIAHDDGCPALEAIERWDRDK